MEFARVCNVCGVEKPASQLVASKRYRGGYMPCCKPCRNEYWRLHRQKNPEARRAHVDAVRRSRLLGDYGLTHARYLEMVEEQGNRCALCNESWNEKFNKRNRYWNVDHCHKTGKMRKLLCQTCNVGLGHFERFVGLVGLEAILKYIEGD